MKVPPSGGRAVPRGLGRVLVEVGVTLAEAEVRDRCESLDRTPLGAILRAGFERRRQIEAEGRHVEDGDIADFIEQVPAIVRAQGAEGSED